MMNSSKKWGMKESYHIMLDSGMLGIDGIVDILEKIYREKTEKTEKPEKAEKNSFRIENRTVCFDPERAPERDSEQCAT